MLLLLSGKPPERGRKTTHVVPGVLILTALRLTLRSVRSVTGLIHSCLVSRNATRSRFLVLDSQDLEQVVRQNLCSFDLILSRGAESSMNALSH